MSTNQTETDRDFARRATLNGLLRHCEECAQCGMAEGGEGEHCDDGQRRMARYDSLGG